ncbi:MAG: FecR family protein [Thermodesulfobacteriota bacterium]
MNFRQMLGFILLLTLSLLAVSGVQAAIVGHLTQVEGQVELMRQGKLPFLLAKVKDGVEPGDVIRTKSASRAQISFIDGSSLTIAPGSRVGLEDFSFDSQKGHRQAVLQIFQGLVRCVVPRLFQVEKPDFIMKTQTATLGVRGTSWYTLIGINFTQAFAEKGMIQVSSLPGAVPGTVLLAAWEHTLVKKGLAPIAPRLFTPEILHQLQNWLINGVPPGVVSGGLAQTLWLQREKGGMPHFPQRPAQVQGSLYIPPVVPPQPLHPQSPGGASSSGGSTGGHIKGH